MSLMEEKGPSSSEALRRKLDEILSETDVGQTCFKEETVEKFMQELYKEIIIASPTTPPSEVPSSSSLQVVAEDKTDDHDDDDEWLARVLNWGQLLDTTSDCF